MVRWEIDSAGTMVRGFERIEGLERERFARTHHCDVAIGQTHHVARRRSTIKRSRDALSANRELNDLPRCAAETETVSRIPRVGRVLGMLMGDELRRSLQHIRADLSMRNEFA